MNKFSHPYSVLMLVAVSIAIYSNALAGIERASLAGNVTQANAGSYQAAISDDGRYIAFRSNASNLVGSDTNNMSDIFVRDTETGVTERVSVTTEGGQFMNGSFAPSISDDGRFVAFQSNQSSNGDNCWGGACWTKIFVYDRQTHRSIFILPPAGNNPQDRTARLEPCISGNGRFVAFHSQSNPYSSQPPSVNPPQDDHNAAFDIYVYDLQGKTTERVSRDSSGNEGNGDSFSASLSDDGNLVAFYSYSNNLVLNDTNDCEDVFVKNRSTGAVTRASVSSDGKEGNDDSYEPCISGNGRYVAFRSRASNLVPGDTNKAWDIFVHDLQTGKTECVSRASDGTAANADSYRPSISDDGRFVTFRSNASNLVAGDTNNRWDIFVHDRLTGITTRVNLNSSGGQANIHSYAPAISGDAHFVAFESDATNLVTGDTNAARDIFVTETVPGIGN